MSDTFLLLIAGAIAGFIDSIAGGGGLITLPTFTLVVGPGPAAIGTNKVAASLATLAALIVYSRAGHLDWGKSFAFAAWIGIGSFAGSYVSPLIPVELFKWFLAVTCPVILWVVWRKELWVAREVGADPASVPRGWTGMRARIMAVGLLCGFYDGLWGPGGGTFMFLLLLFVAKMPLLQALGASKLANCASAVMSLSGYAAQDWVHWDKGLILAVAMVPAAYFGASHATRSAARIVRPVLAIVVAMLMIRLLS